ncbi:MAG: TIGR03032 family protein [Aureispira sp.]|nr:TIGR03032 family protein [Aureispira sp.]
MNHSNLPPFSMQCTPNVAKLLTDLNCSIGISTYQAGKVIMVSPKNEKQLVQLPRNFNKAMGINIQDNKLLIATKDEVLVLTHSADLAKHYPAKPNTYDGLFIPRAVYFTGQIDIHDIAWGANDSIYAVNTSFSTIIKIDHNYSFTPVWTPPFITETASEDRCHLNGMAMKDGKPKYVTAFNTGDSPRSWKENITKTGVLMDVDTNEFVVKNLPMPHSPRIFDGQLYVLLSATGELASVDIENNTVNPILDLGGFVRGMDKCGDYLFIGISKIRKGSSTFSKLPISLRTKNAGVKIVHLPTAQVVGEIAYLNSVDEIYDIHIIPNLIRPNILNTQRPDYKHGLATPTQTFWGRDKRD